MTEGHKLGGVISKVFTEENSIEVHGSQMATQ